MIRWIARQDKFWSNCWFQWRIFFDATFLKTFAWFYELETVTSMKKKTSINTQFIPITPSDCLPLNFTLFLLTHEIREENLLSRAWKKKKNGRQKRMNGTECKQNVSFALNVVRGDEVKRERFLWHRFQNPFHRQKLDKFHCDCTTFCFFFFCTLNACLLAFLDATISCPFACLHGIAQEIAPAMRAALICRKLKLHWARF